MLIACWSYRITGGYDPEDSDLAASTKFLLFMEGINKCGGIAFYATSVQDVKDKLKQYDY